MFKSNGQSKGSVLLLLLGVIILIMALFAIYSNQKRAIQTLKRRFMELSENHDYKSEAIRMNRLTCFTDEIDPDRHTSKHRIVNRVITDYDKEIEKRFTETVKNKLEPSNIEVVKLARLMMDSPSTHLQKNSRKVVKTPQSEYMLKEIFKEKKGGFFVEAGGLDGERSSNTIWMEQNRQWTGLLVEPDPYFYTQLLGKNRQSWSINACISPTQHTEWLSLEEHFKGQGHIALGATDKEWVTKVPCFPMESLLLALNRTSVDFFSLDVEGLEIKILEAIDHKKLDIKTWTIEYDKVGVDNLQSLMESKGYKNVKRIDYTDASITMYTKDLVFVKDK